jgi:DNA-binding SARP family transcriptional activator
MGRMHFKVFGTPEIRHFDQPLKFPTRKAQAILIYLLVEGRIHPRSQLISLLWPGKSARQGRTDFRVALNHLRETLAEAVEPEKHLIIEQNRLGFNLLSTFSSDLHIILKAFSYCGIPLSQSEIRRREALAALQAAVDLYKGDFLENFTLNEAPDFEVWLTIQREGYYRRMELIFERLCMHYLEAGQALEGTEVATCWTVRHPLSEAAYFWLMQAHFIRGKRNEALQAYEQCRAKLEGELHINLASETIALAARIRVSSAIAPASIPRPGKPRLIATLPEAPLVGRGIEFARLIEEYYATSQDIPGPRIFGIQGEAGI